MADDLRQSQTEFIEKLGEKTKNHFSSQLDGEFNIMNVTNGFYWGIQTGVNNYYNDKALSQMSLNVDTGSNGIMIQGESNFITLYNAIMNNVAYAFSSEDQERLNTEQTNANSQIQAVINSWESDTGGEITDGMINDSGCFPKTKLGYIEFMVQDKWDGDIDKIPTSMNGFVNSYQNYLVAAQLSHRLYSASAKAMERVEKCRSHSLNATQENGGLRTGSDTYHSPFGPFPTQNTINSSLQALENKITIDMSLSNFDSTTSSLSIEGGAGIRIPVLSFLNIGVGGSSSYSLDQFVSSGSSVNIHMEYQGVTFVGAPLTQGNLSTNLKTGWYDADILDQAISNRDGALTGYQLTSNQFPSDEYFGQGGKFSRIKSWVISQQPTIKMKFCSANTTLVEETFKQNSSVDVKLFGLFTIGSVDQSYEVSNVHKDTSSGCVTVTMSAPAPIGTTAATDSTAYVLGGVASYPPIDS